MSLGETIRITRQRSFYTQEAFAKELHVALSTVNRWELDKAKPNVRAMKEIKAFCEKHECDYCNIENEWLLLNIKSNQSEENNNG